MSTYNIPASQTSGTQVSPAQVTEPRDRSLGELFGDLTRETTTLVRQEIALAQAEISQKISHATQDVVKIAAGGAVAYAGLIVFLIGVAIALNALGMPTWLAYLLVGGIVLAVGGFLAKQGMDALKQVDPVPHRTVETLKDDAQWAKEQV